MYIQLLLHRHIQALGKVLYTILIIMVQYHNVHTATALVKVLYTILILMVQYHYVHTATTITQAHPGLSEVTVHHSYTHGSIPSCTYSYYYTGTSRPYSEGTVHHFYTHGSCTKRLLLHRNIQALVNALFTILILMVHTIMYIQLLHSGLSEGILYSVHMQYSV